MAVRRQSVKRYTMTIWALLLCLVVSSCASYRVAVLPGPRATVNHSDDVRIVGSGAKVRIHLHSGEIVEGKVIRATSEELVLGHASNYGVEEDVYPASIIQKIELGVITPGGQAAMVFFMSVAALVVYGLFTFEGVY